ncbi:type I-C CRISPR-associated protein Cas5c [Paenibacillus sp. GCM10012307]|uniref:pre-crRNA processing endonuclease n=1 Tax=Paenibacillus roseus TaxID=2798579 RepID=A0A934J6D8_9BACL|nr:type I-C CRISPR-associated protein Cas5c [Paenibacillus roseus]MBJ6361153.1 type I-C CRISPR-associated protein Cas5 [Paenibacillus roseus]
MGYGIRLLVWGSYACFARSDYKDRRVSYDVMTPSAARGVLESIHWKPAIRWVVDRIDVINEIQLERVSRIEMDPTAAVSGLREPMSGKRPLLSPMPAGEQNLHEGLLLRDVKYVIHAHFVMTPRAGEQDHPEKHYNIFLRRARKRQCFYHPYLGAREFPAIFTLLEDHDMTPLSCYKDQPDRELGCMLWDLDFKHEMKPLYFKAIMRGGTIAVPDLLQKDAKS